MEKSYGISYGETYGETYGIKKSVISIFQI